MILLLAVVAFCVSGAYVTRSSVRSQLEYHPPEFSEEQLRLIEKHLYDSFAVNCLDDPISKALVVRMDLVRVEAEAAPANTALSLLEEGGPVTMALSRIYNPFLDQYKFNAVFQKYTYFAILFGQIRIVDSATYWC